MRQSNHLKYFKVNLICPLPPCSNYILVLKVECNIVSAYLDTEMHSVTWLTLTITLIFRLNQEVRKWAWAKMRKFCVNTLIIRLFCWIYSVWSPDTQTALSPAEIRLRTGVCPPPSRPILLLASPRCPPQHTGSVFWLLWRAPSLLPWHHVSSPPLSDGIPGRWCVCYTHTPTTPQSSALHFKGDGTSNAFWTFW